MQVPITSVTFICYFALETLTSLVIAGSDTYRQVGQKAISQVNRWDKTVKKKCEELTTICRKETRRGVSLDAAMDSNSILVHSSVMGSGFTFLFWARICRFGVS